MKKITTKILIFILLFIPVFQTKAWLAELEPQLSPWVWAFLKSFVSDNLWKLDFLKKVVEIINRDLNKYTPKQQVALTYFKLLINENLSWIDNIQQKYYGKYIKQDGTFYQIKKILNDSNINRTYIMVWDSTRQYYKTTEWWIVYNKLANFFKKKWVNFIFFARASHTLSWVVWWKSPVDHNNWWFYLSDIIKKIPWDWTNVVIDISMWANDIIYFKDSKQNIKNNLKKFIEDIRVVKPKVYFILSTPNPERWWWVDILKEIYYEISQEYNFPLIDNFKLVYWSWEDINKFFKQWVHFSLYWMNKQVDLLLSKIF